MNSIVASIASNKTGLPTVTKKYLPVFKKTSENISVGQRIKNLGKNILDTLHPTAGVRALDNGEIISKYSGYSSTKDVSKLFDQIKAEGGDPDKVFNKTMGLMIDGQKASIASQTKLQNAGANVDTSGMNEVLSQLNALKDKSYTAIKDIDDNSHLGKTINAFFGEKNNPLVYGAKKINAILRTGALAIEAGLLGFGLPAINQKILEKKYLGKDAKNKCSDNKTRRNLHADLKSQEIKLYHSFVK